MRRSPRRKKSLPRGIRPAEDDQTSGQHGVANSGRFRWKIPARMVANRRRRHESANKRYTASLVHIGNLHNQRRHTRGGGTLTRLTRAVSPIRRLGERMALARYTWFDNRPRRAATTRFGAPGPFVPGIRPASGVHTKYGSNPERDICTPSGLPIGRRHNDLSSTDSSLIVQHYWKPFSHPSHTPT